jgi:hypothetical protein
MLNVYFEDIEYVIREYLLKANREVIIVVAWINTNLFNDIFIQLLAKKVKISIMYNNDAINKNIVKKITGINYKSIDMPNKKNKMHNKFCIIDNTYVITGSYNWSKAAIDNFENIIISSNKDIIYKFLFEFNQLFQLEQLYQDAKNTGRCNKCNGKTIILAVLTNENYYNCEDSLTLYEVCTKNEGHNKLIKNDFFINITNTLGTELPELEPDEYTTEKESSNYNKFNHEIFYLNALFNVRINNEYNTFFHAIAVDAIQNFEEVMQGYDNEEYHYLRVIWKNRYLSQIINDQYDSIL